MLYHPCRPSRAMRNPPAALPPLDGDPVSRLAEEFGVAATLVSACAKDNTRLLIGGSVLQPSAPFVGGGFSVSTQIQPQFLLRQPVGPFGCPALPPLITTFEIVVLRAHAQWIRF